MISVTLIIFPSFWKYSKTTLTLFNGKEILYKDIGCTIKNDPLRIMCFSHLPFSLKNSRLAQKDSSSKSSQNADVSFIASRFYYFLAFDAIDSCQNTTFKKDASSRLFQRKDTKTRYGAPRKNVLQMRSFRASFRESVDKKRFCIPF